MTPADIKRLRALCEAATPGPNLRGFFTAKRAAMFCSAEQWAKDFIGACRSADCKHTAEEHYDARWHLACVYLDVLGENREFRTALPALLDECEALRRERDEALGDGVLSAGGATSPRSSHDRHHRGT